MTTKIPRNCHKKWMASRLVCGFCMVAVSLAGLGRALSYEGTVVDESEWDYVSYGNQIPPKGNADWENFTGSATSEATHGASTLIINTNGDVDQQAYFNSTLWSPAVSGKVAVEVRLRLAAVAERSASNVTPVLQLGTEAGGLVVCLGEDGLSFVPESISPAVSGVNAFEFHTYRFTIDLATNTFSLDIDGQRQLSDLSLDVGSAGQILRIGDMTSSRSGIVEYEYIAIKNSNAKTPEVSAALLRLTNDGRVTF